MRSNTHLAGVAMHCRFRELPPKPACAYVLSRSAGVTDPSASVIPWAKAGVEFRQAARTAAPEVADQRDRRNPRWVESGYAKTNCDTG